MGLSIVILAAGNSTRMCSNIPKVLHHLGGKPLLQHVLDRATNLQPTAIYGVVNPAILDQIEEKFANVPVNWVVQKEQLGTGHAVLQALPNIGDESNLLVLYGDVPNVSLATLEKCVSSGERHLTILTADVANPSGYGRIVRDDHGMVLKIVEDKDTDESSRSITEINSGIMCGPARLFREILPCITRENNQKELYLTDVVGIANDRAIKIQAIMAESESEIAGINDRQQLADAERTFQRQVAEYLMRSGTTLLSPETLRIRGSLRTGLDCEIDSNVQIEGTVVLGNNVSIGMGCFLKDVVIADNVTIRPYTLMEGATIGVGCEIGPSARLRPNTVLKKNVRVGNFVEIKNATLEDGVKAGHLAYIGDATVGAGTNIGAGAITCNFDGVSKNRTTIGKNVFIGTNCSLVAPITISDGAFIAAGTTVNKTHIEKDQLAVARAPLKIIPNWSKRMKYRPVDKP